MRPEEPGFEELWTNFHDLVNMSGHELRTWLLTEASGEEAFTASPGLAVPGMSRRILHALDKRKADVTAEDIEVMERVVGHVTRLLAERPADAERDENWRHALMNLGHDPLKPASPRDEAEAP